MVCAVVSGILIFHPVIRGIVIVIKIRIQLSAVIPHQEGHFIAVGYGLMIRVQKRPGGLQYGRPRPHEPGSGQIGSSHIRGRRVSHGTGFVTNKYEINGLALLLEEADSDLYVSVGVDLRLLPYLGHARIVLCALLRLAVSVQCLDLRVCDDQVRYIYRVREKCVDIALLDQRTAAGRKDRVWR